MVTYASASVSKRTDSSRLGSLGDRRADGGIPRRRLRSRGRDRASSIAREFGRTDETDGLLAAYGVFIVIAVAAHAIRVAVLPTLARARGEQRLASELAGYYAAVLVVAAPLLLVASSSAPTGSRRCSPETSPRSRPETAADALVWIVPAGLLHLLAGLAASGLAALDDYATAAFGLRDRERWPVWC